MRRALTIFLGILFAAAAMAQRPDSYTISGYVTDAASGERLIGAAVYDTISRQGTVTNTAGFYTLTVNKPHPSPPLKGGGENPQVVLVASYVGYEPVISQAPLNPPMEGGRPVDGRREPSVEVTPKSWTDY